MENIKCILCNSDDADFFIEDEGLKAVKCKRCGLVYVNPRPEFAELKAGYSGTSLMKAEEHIAAIDEKTLKARLDLELIKRYKKEGRMLEIGCAEGSFLSEATKQGYEPHGIEINKKFVEYARNEYRLPDIYEGDILGSSFPEGHFDVIYMRNVLSHLHDPIKELGKVNKFLKDGGIFVCVGGNMGGLSVKQIRKYRDFISPHLSQHLFHYSEENIRCLFGKAGFRIEKIYRFSAYLDECNGLLFRIINCVLNKESSIKALAFIRVLLGKLWFKKGRLLSLIIFASKERPQ